VSKQSPGGADTPQIHGHLVQGLRAIEDLAKVLDPNLPPTERHEEGGGDGSE
jgi:hypothetical protein